MKQQLQTFTRPLFLVLFAAVLFSGCRKSKKKPQWDIDAISPILKSELSINNLVTSSSLTTDSTNQYQFVFNNTLATFSLDSLIEIPDTAIIQRIDTLYFVSFYPGQPVPIAQNHETEIDIKDVALTYAEIQSGTIEVEIKSTFTEPTIIDYELISATKNGNTFKISEAIPAGTLSSPASVTKTYPFNNYSISLLGNSIPNYNKILSNITAQVAPHGDSLLPGFSDYLEISYRFTDLNPSYAKGYFGQLETTITNGESEFNLLPNVLAGSVDLKDISLNLNVKNGLGADLEASINRLTMIREETNESISLDHDIIQQSLQLNRALEIPGTPKSVQYAEYKTTISTSNSNINEAIANFPNKVQYDASITLNPLGNISGYNDFLVTDYGIDIDLQASIPINANINGLLLCDTIEFDPGEKTIKEAQYQVNGNLYLYAENGFPLDVEPQLYLMNEAYEIIDSLVIQGNYFEAATTINSIVENPLESSILLPLNPTKIDKLYESKFVKITTKLTSQPSNEYFPIYDYYAIKMQLIGDVNYVIDPNIEDEK